MDDERVDLADERGFLLASLDDLEAERAAGDLTEPDYLALRAGYERRAVDVLSALAADGPEPEEGAPLATKSSRGERGDQRRRVRRRVVAVLAVAGVALGAGLVVDGSAGNRLPTQTITGSVPPAIGNELVNAQVALAKGNEVAALKLFQAVLAVQPNQPEALAGWGWIVANSGAASKNHSLLARGIASIEAAIRADPSYPDAHLLLGLARLGSGDPAAAVAELHRYLALNPSPQDAQAAKAALAKAEAAVAARSHQGSPGPGPAAGPTPTSGP